MTHSLIMLAVSATQTALAAMAVKMHLKRSTQVVAIVVSVIDWIGFVLSLFTDFPHQ